MHWFADNKFYQSLAFATAIVFTLLCLVVPLLNPVANWDMLGYAGSVKSLLGMNVDDIHRSVYSEFAAYASAGSFEVITGGTSYRQTMYEDAAAFSQQIPFYKIRILYVSMLTGLHQLGFELFAAMHVISAVFGAAAYLLIYFGTRDQVHSLVWLVTPGFYYFLTVEFGVFQNGGVDTFSFFWVAMTAVAFFRNSKLLYPLLALAVLVRTDLILYVALMFAVSFLRTKEDWLRCIFWGTVTLIFYSAVNSWSGNYGWSTLIHFVFITDMLATHPAEYSQLGLSIQEYINVVLTKHDWISSWFWLAFFVSILNLILYVSMFHFSWLKIPATTKASYLKQFHLFSTICLIYIVLHYLLFPLVLMRFFYGQCFLSVFATLATVGQIMQTNHATDAAGIDSKRAMSS